MFGLRRKWGKNSGVPKAQPPESIRYFYLVAEPGYPNYGDELIAREWLRYLSKRYPEIPIVVDCARPGPAAVILREIHPHVIFTDTLRRLGTEGSFPYDGPIKDINTAVSAALDNDGLMPNYASGIRLLQHNTRSIHFLGGGYMRGDWTSNLSRLAVGPWAMKRGIPTAATGLGLMPLSGESLEFAQRAASTFSVFTVRDTATLQVLQADAKMSQKIQLAPDDCFVNGLEGCYMDPEGLPNTMLCIQSDFVKERVGFFSQIERVLQQWDVDKSSQIGIVECNPRIDRLILDYLAEQGYVNLRFFPVIELLERGFPARPGQQWISSRYHPHILAAARGCRGSFVSVDSEYYDVKHEAVLRMGSHWTNIVPRMPIPNPGIGFENASLSVKYAKQIQKSVNGIYS